MQEMAGGIIGNMFKTAFGEALLVVNTASWLMDKVLTLNYVLMSALVSAVTYAYASFLEICNTLMHVCRCLIEDFCIFLSDIISIVSSLGKATSDFLLGAVDTVSGFFTIIGQIISNVQEILNLILDIITCMGQYVIKLMRGINYAFMLVGSAILLVLQSIPKLFVFIVTWFYGVCKDSFYTTYEGVLNISVCTINEMYNFKNKFIYSIKNIPTDAYLGLVLVIICYFVLRRTVSHVSGRVIGKYIVKLLLLVLSSFTNLLIGIYSLLKSSFAAVLWNWHQRNALENSHYNGNEEDEDDHGEVVVVNRRQPTPPVVRRSAKGKASSSKPKLEKICYCCGKPNQGDEPMCERCIAKRLEEELQTEREGRACIVCQDISRNILLLPCRHLCLCRDCVEIILQENSICPMCRQYIVHAIQVYI